MNNWYCCSDWQDVDSIKLVGEKISGPDKNGYAKFSKSEHPLSHAYCFPEHWLERVKKVVSTRQEFKKQLDDSMSLVFKLRNQLTKEQNGES